MVQLGVNEIDIHEMNQYQAKVYIDSQLKNAKKSTYRLRVIHGFHGGTKLQEMVRTRYRNHPKVLRIEIGANPGETDLVLRELF